MKTRLGVLVGAFCLLMASGPARAGLVQPPPTQCPDGTHPSTGSCTQWAQTFSVQCWATDDGSFDPSIDGCNLETYCVALETFCAPDIPLITDDFGLEGGGGWDIDRTDNQTYDE